ncbi:hypothetical protein DPV78_004134 [Talaromyces pinophilus]|nr:hypothetical protein DPV78_004134 [Talaromyces pinophilus]
MECWKRHVELYDPARDKETLQLRKGQTITPMCLDFDENDEDSDAKLAQWTWTEESRFIWIHVHQGAGKTTLVTTLVTDLDNKLGGSKSYAT